MPVLVTGAAGFIGSHCVARMVEMGMDVIGVDNLNSYYDPQLKRDRLAELHRYAGFEFLEADISDRDAIASIFKKNDFSGVLHLAAQAGVRYSLMNPFAYTESNITGTLVMLEACRNFGVEHFVYASSSSVYGANIKQPFSVEDRTDSPVSLYAATKKANELMCQTYAHLYGIPCTGLRFFTVYGPWGRPDMAYYKFSEAMTEGRPIDVYNHGRMSRDFTFIDDIVDGVIGAFLMSPSTPGSGVPHRVYNLGNNRPEPLMELIRLLEINLGVQAKLNYLPMQQGDVEETYADIARAKAELGFEPKTSLAEGIEKFCEWFRRRPMVGPA